MLKHYGLDIVDITNDLWDVSFKWVINVNEWSIKDEWN